jgi:NAD(P)-dependent dehydrogenase (short-subunit alcohol dehydrogenase family)
MFLGRGFAQRKNFEIEAKGGMHSLTKLLAASLGRHGITVNDINPDASRSSKP